MSEVADEKYRNFEVIRGGAQRPTRLQVRGRRRGRRMKTAAELVLEREIRDAFARLQDRDGRVPSEAIQKIREGVQQPMGCTARRIVEAHAAGCSHQSVREIALRFVRWVDKLFEPSSETVTEQVYFQGPRRCA